MVGIAFATILLVGLITTNVSSEKPKENVILDGNQVPIVNSPLDVIYVEGTTGHTIVWEISDDDPGYYLTFRDGMLLDAVSWDLNNETVIVDINGLPAGNYEYMILISDHIINVTDFVLVTVLPSDIEVHAPFSISSNTNFNDTAQAEGWTGNGSISDPFIIEKLYIEASYDCISIHGTDVHFIIRNCTFVKDGKNSGIGINLQGVSNGVIEFCTFTNLWIGCITWFSSDCTWDYNTFGNIQDGLWIQESLDCTIIHNNFQTGGISFSGYAKENWLHILSDNTIQGEPIGYFQGLISQDIDASAYGQIIIANCSDVWAWDGMFSGVGVPISIGYSNSCGAYNCIMEDGRYGVFVEHSYNVEITGCEIFSMSELGLYINMTTLTGIFNCTIKNIQWVGVQLGMAPETTISGSTIQGCGELAIGIYESPDFMLVSSVVDHNHNGLSMGGCSDSNVIDNSFQYNDRYGIEIFWDCENSYFYDNVFSYNSLSNAYDDGSDTFWDDGISKGNTWSDYGGSGYYYVPGSRGGIDHYPSIIDITPEISIIDLTNDITYIFGTTGHKIIWYPNCSHPLQYTIFKDGNLVKFQEWDGSIIQYIVDGLPLGTYNFTLVIMDTFNQTASDTVWVEVIQSTTTPTGTTTTNTTTTTTTNGTIPGGFEQITLAVSIGSTVVIIVVIVLMIRTKRNV